MPARAARALKKTTVTNPNLRAAIYSRISDADKLDDGTLDIAGVRRLEEQCKRYCEQRGWTYTIFRENNRSASGYAKRKRDVFDGMLVECKAGRYDVIVVAEMSRFTRDPESTVGADLIKGQLGAVLHAAQGGEYDVTTGHGKMRARFDMAFAASYSDFISDKICSAVDEKRENGEHWGGHAAFGYQGPHDDSRGRYVRAGIDVDPVAAKAIRNGIDAILRKGGTLAGVARTWNAQGLRTSRKGALWSHVGVRAVLLNPRNAGKLARIVGYDGAFVRYEILGDAEWQAIIGFDEYKRIARALGCTVTADGRVERSATAPKRRAAKRGLLTGLVRCASCGEVMTSNASQRADGLFVCNSNAARPNACGKNSIAKGATEKLIEDEAIEVLSSAKLWKAIARAHGTNDSGAEDPAAILAEMDELAAMIADQTYTARQGAPMNKALQERLAIAEAASENEHDTTVLDRFRGSKNVRSVWGKLDLDAKRAVLAALIERIDIVQRPEHERHRKGTFSIDRIDPRWRY